MSDAKVTIMFQTDKLSSNIFVPFCDLPHERQIFTLNRPEPREKISLTPENVPDTTPSCHHDRVKTPFEGHAKDTKSGQKDKPKSGFHPYISKNIKHL